MYINLSTLDSNKLKGIADDKTNGYQDDFFSKPIMLSKAVLGSFKLRIVWEMVEIYASKYFIFQLREYLCNDTYDISFDDATNIFRTKNYKPRIFLELEFIFSN